MDNEKAQVDKVFNDLQDSMERKASIYKGTKFDPFYQFCIGNMDWGDAIQEISKHFKHTEGYNVNINSIK